jgi:HAD superfamily hydrolase (TIGR01662 family)
MARLRAVFFDVGETIVDESREYGIWADWLGVPRHIFSAVFGAVIARGGDHRATFQYFQPGFDLIAERERRAMAGQPDSFGEEHLYPDTRPCLNALRGQGLLVGIAGNETSRAERILRSLDLPVDIIGSSDGWGAEKPAAAFFQRLVEEAGCPAEQVLYVGDRLDNDVKPAQLRGIATAFVRRGPWAYILHDEAVLNRCLFWLESLADLPDLVAQYNAPYA